MAESTLRDDVRHIHPTIPLVLGFGLIVVFSTQKLIHSESLALIEIYPLVRRGLLVGVAVLGIGWIVGPRSVRGPTLAQHWPLPN